jgi:molecular chaperone GrpE (heat shock protein)
MNFNLLILKKFYKSLFFKKIYLLKKMLLKQITKNIFTNKATLSLDNFLRRSFLTSFNSIKINKAQNNLFLSRPIISRNFFSSNKEEKKESKKEEETKKEEKSDKEEESDKDAKKENNEEQKALNKKYTELKTLYQEQEQKLDQARKKFHEIKDLYLKGIDEIDHIKLRTDKEIKNTKEYAITKFAKDLLDVHDNFTRALNVVGEKDFKTLTQEEKDETFAMFVEGKKLTH